MRIAVIGGKLQGLEALYLARKAGIQTVLIDKNSNAPAATLCDIFVCHRFSPQKPIPQLNQPIDLILPALEDEEVLSCLANWSAQHEIPLAFDMQAFLFSQSKRQSNALFESLGLPIPKNWPDADLPVIVKPDHESGSRGVRRIEDEETLAEYCAEMDGKAPVIQQYLDGPSYSIEVLGIPGHYHAGQVTELHMDPVFDCCSVTAPSRLPTEEEERLVEMAILLAEALELRGIMDLEVILHCQTFKVLEIDARLPSQTPITVYHSTGLNLVEQLCNLFLGLPVRSSHTPRQWVCVEHVLVDQETITVTGEHIIGESSFLEHHHAFFGADEAITNYTPQKKRWVATMIFTGNTYKDLTQKKSHCYGMLQKHLALSSCHCSVHDPQPSANLTVPARQNI